MFFENKKKYQYFLVGKGAIIGTLNCERKILEMLVVDGIAWSASSLNLLFKNFFSQPFDRFLFYINRFHVFLYL